MPPIRILILVLLAQAGVLGRVERVVDGDTIKVHLGGRLETVRYIGVDTPETVHPARGVEPYGKEASRFNASLVGGRMVRLEFDVERRDRYGRLLAYVYVDTLFVNAELLRQGYAQLMTVPPNVRHVEDFVQLQQQARELNRGLWGQVSTGIDTQAPSDSTGVLADATRRAASITVYVTRTGSKYHRVDCRYLRHAGIPLPLEAALRQYESCSVCITPAANPGSAEHEQPQATETDRGRGRSHGR